MGKKKNRNKNKRKNKLVIEPIDKNKLYSATSLVNYIRSDCIVDLIEMLNKNDYQIDLEDEFKIKKRKFNDLELEERIIKPSINCSDLNSNKRRRTSSFDYIIDDGHKFESNIVIKIKEKLKMLNEYDKLIELSDKEISKRFDQTKKVLKNKSHDIILGGILINDLNKTYGYPDLIVSGYWINKYIDSRPINITNDRSSYYIIDIKSSSINLISGGEYVSSGLLYDGYKAQIYVYTQALNQILKTNINIGFILGKNYQYNSGGNKIKIEDPFAKLGIIDYQYEKNIGRDFEQKISQAIKWKEELNKNYSSYTLLPINNDLLYPNMKNPYDKNHRRIKKEIALANKEITLLWNCGVKNRDLAWSRGIKNYENNKLSPEILGFTNKSSRYNILNSMLELNRSTDKLLIFNSSNNKNDWQTKSVNEFYVDFETYSNEKLYGDTIEYYDEEYYDINGHIIIYMIGVNYFVDSISNFKCFILKFNSHERIQNYIKSKSNLKCDHSSYIFCDNEKELIKEFVKFINSFNKKNDLKNYYKNTRLFHWSKAEPIIFKKKILEYKLKENKFILPWFDLLEVFKNEDNPILIKGCFGFGLKEIINKLNQYEFIKLRWPELDDGLLSSFKAKEIYMNRLDSDDKIDIMVSIVEYNYIDCIALLKILEWIRSLII